MNYSLRQVRPDEIDWLYELNRESFFDVVVRQFGHWDEASQQEMFFSKCEQPRPAHIIQVGEHRAGVVIVEQLEDCNWLHEIQISPDHQGQGLGTTLMHELLANARSRRVPLRLQVLHANQRAKRLYERMGFLEIQKQKNHYLMEAPQQRQCALQGDENTATGQDDHYCPSGGIGNTAPVTASQAGKS